MSKYKGRLFDETTIGMIKEDLKMKGIENPTVAQMIRFIEEEAMNHPKRELHKAISLADSSLQANSGYRGRRFLQSEGYERGSTSYVEDLNAVRYWHTDGYGRVVQSILTKDVLEEMLKRISYYDPTNKDEF